VLRPRVVVSQGLLERLSDAELRAVLEHEGYHVANLDPLKLVVLRVRDPYATGSPCALAVSGRGELPRSGAVFVLDRCVVGMS
jgi:Peptidase family M48